MSNPHMQVVSDSVPVTSPFSPADEQGHRYAAFKRHIVTCPACSAAHVEMCQQGYWLLIGALGIVAPSPQAAA